MKALILAIIIAIAGAPLHAEGDKNMSLSFEPMGLLNGSIPITFNLGLASRFSLGLNIFDKVFNISKVNVTGVGGGLGAKFHLSADGFQDGWYLKPEATVGYWTVGEEEGRSRGIGVEPRLVAGYDWIWQSGFNLSLGFGVKYFFYTGNKAAVKDIVGFGSHGIFPNADFGLGWAF